MQSLSRGSARVEVKHGMCPSQSVSVTVIWPKITGHSDSVHWKIKVISVTLTVFFLCFFFNTTTLYSIFTRKGKICCLFRGIFCMGKGNKKWLQHTINLKKGNTDKCESKNLHFPKLGWTGSSINGNPHKFRLFRFLFYEENNYIVAKSI